MDDTRSVSRSVCGVSSRAFRGVLEGTGGGEWRKVSRGHLNRGRDPEWSGTDEVRHARTPGETDADRGVYEVRQGSEGVVTNLQWGVSPQGLDVVFVEGGRSE